MRRPASRQLVVRCLLAFLATSFAAYGQGKTTDDLADPKLAMTVDGRIYPVRIVDMLVNAARQSRKDAGWGNLLDNLAENQLVAAHVDATTGRKKLMVADRVGFAPEILREEQFGSLIKQNFRAELDAYVKSRPGGNLKGLIAWEIPRTDPAVKELSTLRNLGEVRYTPAQLELAGKTIVARLVMPDGKKHEISGKDVYDRMNVQGRVRLLQDHEINQLYSQIRQYAESLFIAWWASTRSGLGERDIALLHTLFEEKQLRERFLVNQGVVIALHEDAPQHIVDVQKQVTPKEIHAWYDKHKEEFRQVERVKARHIRCATEADCNAAKAAIDKGMEFSKAARKFSIAADKTATPAGSLGWVVRESKDLPWLHQVALIQQKGQMTPPIRSPEDAKGNAVWEIVIVDERIEGYSAPESETVAYQARQEIAKKKVVQEYRDLRTKLLASANIHRNAALLRERGTHDEEDDLEALQNEAEKGHAHDQPGHGHQH